VVAADPKFKKYTQAVEKCLATFDNVHEWADFIAFLGKLLKVRVTIRSISCHYYPLFYTCMYKSMCAEKRPFHLRADPSRIYAIQGDTPQVDRLETPRTMFESCITYWSTSESIGRICTYLGRLGCKCLSSVLPPSLPHSSFANHSGF
jgi:hypothetical protein